MENLSNVYENNNSSNGIIQYTSTPKKQEISHLCLKLDDIGLSLESSVSPMISSDSTNKTKNSNIQDSISLENLNIHGSISLENSNMFEKIEGLNVVYANVDTFNNK